MIPGLVSTLVIHDSYDLACTVYEPHNYGNLGSSVIITKQCFTHNTFHTMCQGKCSPGENTIVLLEKFKV